MSGLVLRKNLINGATVALAEEHQVHAEVIETVPWQAIVDSRGERVGSSVGPVERFVEAAEDRRHGEIKFAVAIDSVGVNEVRLVVGEHEVAGPQVTVEQAGFHRVILVVVAELVDHLGEVFLPPPVPPAAVTGNLNLG